MKDWTRIDPDDESTWPPSDHDHQSGRNPYLYFFGAEGKPLSTACPTNFQTKLK